MSKSKDATDKLNIKYFDIEKLIPYIRNPRKNDEQVDRMTSAIKEFGFRIPVVARSDGSVVDGHLRLKAAQKLGLKEVPVVLADELSDAQVKAFRILANRSANWASWDDELLKVELEDLLDMGYDLDLTGFDQSEIDALLATSDDVIQSNADPDEVPDPPTKCRARHGDIFVCGNHRVMCGDSRKIENYDLLLGDQKISLMHTDPPYNINYESKGEAKLAKLANDNMNDDEFRDFLQDIFANIDAYMLPGAAFYIWHCFFTFHLFRDAIVNNDWYISAYLVWVKTNSTFGFFDYKWKHEPCFYGWNRRGGHKFYGPKAATTVLEFSKPILNDLHPTMKPIDLCAYLIENSTQKGELVIDPFGGSGSTLIACEQLGRRCATIEIMPVYADVIVKRWQDYTGQKAFRESDNVPFDDIEPVEPEEI